MHTRQCPTAPLRLRGDRLLRAGGAGDRRGLRPRRGARARGARRHPGDGGAGPVTSGRVGDPRAQPASCGRATGSSTSASPRVRPRARRSPGCSWRARARRPLSLRMRRPFSSSRSSWRRPGPCPAAHPDEPGRWLERLRRGFRYVADRARTPRPARRRGRGVHVLRARAADRGRVRQGHARRRGLRVRAVARGVGHRDGDRQLAVLVAPQRFAPGPARGGHARDRPRLHRDGARTHPRGGLRRVDRRWRRQRNSVGRCRHRRSEPHRAGLPGAGNRPARVAGKRAIGLRLPARRRDRSRALTARQLRGRWHRRAPGAARRRPGPSGGPSGGASPTG